jgi:hypothetical protein
MPQAILVSDWLISKKIFSETAWPRTSIDASYQVSVHFAMQFQRRRFFRNRPIRNKNCLWQPCLLMNWDKMSNLYRGCSKDAPYQVSIHWQFLFLIGRFLKNLLL